MKKKLGTPFLDIQLLLIALTLATIGLIMVASSSIAIADNSYHNSYYFSLRHGLYLLSGIALGLITFFIPIESWQKVSRFFFLFGIMLLVLVLIPGVGHEVNGSIRWLKFGGFTFQISEFVKLATIIYIAGYVVDYQAQLKTFTGGIIRPMLAVSVVALLLLLEPDFGAVVVISTSSLAILYLAGVRLSHFFAVLGVTGVSFSLIAVLSPYRWQRLTAFLDPWQDQFNSGYQLTQSLIAFGRGEWFGVGLGGSIQKLFYLPEAHNDFMFAVMGEELGFIGLMVIIFLFVCFIAKGLVIAKQALEQEDLFAYLLAQGICYWLALQTLISMGVNTGLLPTKGLTLPLISYGGSSLWITCIATSILLRISYENKRT